MPQISEADAVGALGVTLTQLAVEKLGWIFRRVEHRDVGIDAQVEVVIGSEATGLTLCLQIKSGPSYFGERSTSGWRYRGDYQHLRYWREHSLPVVLVLVDVREQKVYWAFVGATAEIREAENSWTIQVSEQNTVNATCMREWVNQAFAASPVDALYRYCSIHTRYIQLLRDGGDIAVEVDEMINKMSGRAYFKIILTDSSGLVTEEEFNLLAGVRSAAEFASQAFPWATVEVDEDFYYSHEEVGRGEERAIDVRPYEDDGELARFRFKLVLNQVGRAMVHLATAAQGRRNYPFIFARVLERER